jgi:hypothetical protein
VRRLVDAALHLFVDDGFLAVAILVWVAAAGLLLPRVAPRSMVQAALFSVGLAVIITRSAIVAARARRD